MSKKAEMACANWISANDAAKLLERTYGGRRAAKDALADLLRDKELQARAELHWHSSDPEWLTQSADAEVSSDCDIPYLEWLQSKRWRKDQDRWNWRTNTFLVTISKKPFVQSIMKGVMFNRAQVEQIVMNGKPLPPRGGGRRPHRHIWEKFAVALVHASKNGILDPGTCKTVNDLFERIDSSGELDVHDSVLRPIVGTLFREFCLADGQSN